MKKKELTSQDEALNDWLDRNLIGLITFVVLVMVVCGFLIYQICKP
jgi:predicted negative regulator of RcsB-dependent stress response